MNKNQSTSVQLKLHAIPQRNGSQSPENNRSIFERHSIAELSETSSNDVSYEENNYQNQKKELLESLQPVKIKRLQNQQENKNNSTHKYPFFQIEKNNQISQQLSQSLNMQKTQRSNEQEYVKKLDDSQQFIRIQQQEIIELMKQKQNLQDLKNKNKQQIHEKDQQIDNLSKLYFESQKEIKAQAAQVQLLLKQKGDLKNSIQMIQNNQGIKYIHKTQEKDCQIAIIQIKEDFDAQLSEKSLSIQLLQDEVLKKHEQNNQLSARLSYKDRIIQQLNLKLEQYQQNTSADMNLDIVQSKSNSLILPTFDREFKSFYDKSNYSHNDMKVDNDAEKKKLQKKNDDQFHIIKSQSQQIKTQNQTQENLQKIINVTSYFDLLIQEGKSEIQRIQLQNKQLKENNANLNENLQISDSYSLIQQIDQLKQTNHYQEDLLKKAHMVAIEVLESKIDQICKSQPELNLENKFRNQALSPTQSIIKKHESSQQFLGLQSIRYIAPVTGQKKPMSIASMTSTLSTDKQQQLLRFKQMTTATCGMYSNRMDYTSLNEQMLKNENSLHNAKIDLTSSVTKQRPSDYNLDQDHN